MPPPRLICLCLVVGLSSLIVQSEARPLQDTTSRTRELSNIFSHTAREPGKLASIELEFLDTSSSLSATALEQVQQQVQAIKESRQNDDVGEPIRNREEVNGTATNETTTSTSATTSSAESQTREETNSTSSQEAVDEEGSSSLAASDGDGNETSATSSPSTTDLDTTEADSPAGNNSTDDTSEEPNEGDDLVEDATTTTAEDDDDSNGTAVPSDDATLGPSSVESQSPTNSSDLEEATTPDPLATASPTTLVGAGGEEPTAAPVVDTNATSAPTTTPVANNNSNETQVPIPAPTSSPATTTNRNTVVVTVQSWFVVSSAPSNWTSNPNAEEGGATQASTKSLTKAYSQLASDVVNQLNDQVVIKEDASLLDVDAGTVRRYLRLETPPQHAFMQALYSNAQGQGRNLQEQLPSLNATVDYDPSTANLTSIRPSECPPESSGQVCLAAFGQYELDVADSEDPQQVFDVFVFQTQKAIEDGVLQEKLDQVDPDSVFTVVGAPGPSPPPPLSEATTAPDPEKDTAGDNENKSGGGGGLDGVMLGLIIAICVTVFLVAVLLAVYFYLKKSGPAPEIAEKGTDDEADEREGDKDVADSENPQTAPPEAYPGDDADADRDDSDWPSSSNFPDGDPNVPTSNDDDEKLEYKRRVEELVAEHCPEETENVDRMMEQFEGREKALIAMLENMEEVERELEKEQGLEYDDDESSAIDDWSEDPLRQQRNNSEEAKEEVQE